MDKPRGLLNVLGDLWVFRVTGHIPFKDIASHITPENVSRSIQLCYDTLRMAAVENPRIAVAALNPHAGDGGTCGKEEIDVLIPVIEGFREKGMDMYGPVPVILFLFMHLIMNMMLSLPCSMTRDRLPPSFIPLMWA